MTEQIQRDRWGVPQLVAGDVLGLAHLQGRAAALDRAWQVEVARWRSEGVTAARLGAGQVGWDRFARQARLADTARRCFAALDPESRAWCTAFAEGINDGLDEGACRAPEFTAHDTGPGRWEPWSSLAVFLAQHILFGTFPTKLWRARAHAALGAQGLRRFGSEGPALSGSNAWAVTGDRTRSGLPLIAGDPHRVIESPGVYHQVRLTCPEFDVVGFAFPGVPGIPHFGHTGTVAWGITNAMADYQDLFREQLRREGGEVLALGPGGWEPTTTHTEPIAVAGGPAHQVEVVETARGSVVLGGPDDAEAVSLRTPARVESDLGFAALLPLLRSRTAADVERALDRWVEPVNSVVIADASGTVRTRNAGLVPLRHGDNSWLPVPAWTSEHAWTGRYAAMPGSAVDGVRVTANDRRPDTAPLGVEFAPPHRGRRITELLGERTDLTAADMAGIHRDDRCGAVPGAQRALATVVDLTPPARAVRDRLLAWDGRMAAASPDAALYAAWRAELVGLLASHPVLAGLAQVPPSYGVLAPLLDLRVRLGSALETMLEDGAPEGIDLTVLSADALERVAAQPPTGTWGARHGLRPLRVVGDPAGTPAAGPTPVVELAGDTDCVNSTHSIPGVTDECGRGPVARYVWDLADRGASGWVVPLGASGVAGDAHATDQLPEWAAGRLVPVPGAGQVSRSGGSPG